MKPAAPALEYAPIFNWGQPRSRKVSLISFIAASAVLHAFCFYIFQIIYPPTVALLPPPAHVSIITADSEEGRSLLRWLEAEDPALASTTQRLPDAASFSLPKIEHVPSYLARQPALRQLPPLVPDLSIPSSHPPGPVEIGRATPPISRAPSATEVTFSSEVDSLGQAIFPGRNFKTSSKETPRAARFRIALNPGGEVQYCLLQESSGDPQLDAQAAHYLLRVRFPAAEVSESKIENNLLWSSATIEWGNDLATP